MPLGLDGKRDAFVYVPERDSSGGPVPLVVMLHGAGGSADDTLGWMRVDADRFGFLLLVPPSRDYTWDVVLGGYGPDVSFLNRALWNIFTRFNVDPGHVALAGFSDGASYALSLGLTNGKLFSHLIAFSPGFAAPERETGSPRVFISHGTQDNVLPIETCSRRIVPRLATQGLEVLYREFDGSHAVPPAIRHEAFGWFLGEKGFEPSQR